MARHDLVNLTPDIILGGKVVDNVLRLYPAEIVPLRIRAPANAFSTTANWIFNFMGNIIPPSFRLADGCLLGIQLS